MRTNPNRNPMSVLLILAASASAAHAEVFVSEMLASTAANDCEFIEIANTGRDPVDLHGWTLELWDSDADKAFGTHDADSPIKLGGTIDAGGVFLLANPEFRTHYEIAPDQDLRENGIENSSFTLVLRDAYGEIVETIFVTDGGEGDTANINGREIRPDAVIVNPDGRFIPPGFARLDDDADGNRVYSLLKFSPVPPPGATPGRPNSEAGGILRPMRPAEPVESESDAESAESDREPGRPAPSPPP